MSALTIPLTLVGLAAEIDGRGVKACMVCETPAANMNSSLSSVLVLPRAFVGEKFKNILVEKISVEGINSRKTLNF